MDSGRDEEDGEISLKAIFSRRVNRQRRVLCFAAGQAFMSSTHGERSDWGYVGGLGRRL